MGEKEFGLRELYSVKLKATYPMDIGKLHFNTGEVITEFDSLQIANFGEISSYHTANGGFDNRTRIVWDDVKEIPFTFTKGVFNKLQFAMLNNAQIVEVRAGEEIKLTQTEELESNEEGIITLRRDNFSGLVVRDLTGDRISYESLSSNQIKIAEPFKETLVSYNFLYKNGASEMVVGRRFMDGFLEMEAKTRVKDDITGQTHTGILRIPKLKLMSDLSMKLGDQATPLVGNFKAIGCPVGSKGDKKIFEIIFLNDDIDSDL